MNRLAILLLAAIVASSAAASSACSGPHSGKAERLRRPKQKKRPPAEEDAQAQVEEVNALSDAKCRTNFFAAPKRSRRKPRDARKMAQAADGILLDAERSEGDRRKALVLDAMATLFNALKKDPYGPEPTYKLAVAYALSGHKNCAVALLERLALLQDYAPSAREAARTIQRATRDPAFDEFRKDANTALGE